MKAITSYQGFHCAQKSKNSTKMVAHVAQLEQGRLLLEVLTAVAILLPAEFLPEAGGQLLVLVGQDP